MPSRLSSLLVRDGLVGVKRMEKAFQRQVIYGGSLDTTLLEMGLVSEDRLTQYLALTSGLPPANRAECNVHDADAIRACPQDVAVKYRVVPLCFEAGSLRVLVHDPVDMAALEELADHLDVALQPLIVPEYRWHVVFTRNYGGQPTARYSTLARAAESAPAIAPVGRARTVIVDGDDVPPLRPAGPERDTLRMDAITESGAVAAPVMPQPTSPSGRTRGDRRVTQQGVAMPPPPPVTITAGEPTAGEPARPPITARTRTAELVTQSLREHQAAVEAQRVERRAGSGPNRMASGPSASMSDGIPTQPLETGAASQIDTSPVVAPITTTAPELPVVIGSSPGMPLPPLGVSAPIAQVPAPIAQVPVAQAPIAPSVKLAPPVAPASAPPLAPVPPPPAAPRAIDDRPLPPWVARELMAQANDRDAVFYALLRALRSKTRWAGLLTVQGGAVIGRVALSDGLDTTGMASVLVPLDVASPFRSTTHAGHPYVGPLSIGRAELDVMIARMGGVVPPSGLILPIVLRERAVALAIAHRGPDPVTLAEVTELLPLAAATADHLGRLIARSKSVGYRAPAEAAAPVEAIDPTTVATKKAQARSRASGWAVPAQPPVPERPVTAPAALPEPTPPPPPARPIASVVDVIEGDDDIATEAAIAEAVGRLDEVMPVVAERFPGRLRVDRYQVSGRALRPGQYGGLLELVVRLGVPAAELLIERLADPRREVRFYATVCLGAIRPRSAVYALVERLFDGDYGVRGCAIEALLGYPARERDLAMVRARHALHSEDLERVEAAATAIAELGDSAAIPDLLDIVGRDSKRADHARRALMALTRHDHGTSERRWRKWWDEHREHHRLEWLIAALGNRDAQLRGAALDDLRRITGESFGVNDDLSRRDRGETRERWERWWNEFGHRRFVRNDDERHRPTATLPARKE